MDTLKPNISIIVPVFNVENYIMRCLDSIFKQEFSGSLEVIAVEDGSTDNSLSILKKYRDSTPQLKIIEHGTNKKLSIARATGIVASKGEYIMHVDADDWLLPDALENLFSKCIESNADVLVFNYLQVNSEGKRTYYKKINERLITTDKLKVQHHFFGSCVNKIVKRELTLNMITGKIGVNNTEDLLYSTEILLRAEIICLIPQFYYCYFVNSESLTQGFNNRYCLQNQVVILNQIQRIIDNNKCDKDFAINIINYFENYMCLYIANIHFISKEKLFDKKMLIEDFALNSIMDKAHLNKIEKNINNRLFCLINLTKYFGLKTSAYYLIKALKTNKN